jgi:glycopeptide antibiotics resistance protein
MRTVWPPRILFAAYLLALACIVFAPSADAEQVTGIVALVAQAIEMWGVPFELGYALVEFLANIALFAPFGMLLALVAPLWRPWLVIAAGLALSCAIELAQLGLPSRVSAASDLLANTLGTTLGLAVLAVCLRVARLTRGPGGSDDDAARPPLGGGELALQ